jgi:hypothetical protein
MDDPENRRQGSDGEGSILFVKVGGNYSATRTDFKQRAIHGQTGPAAVIGFLRSFVGGTMLFWEDRS